ncbi:MAG: SGNH/GDSL hydrolase family protein [Bacteroidota bacterium]
MIRYLLFFYVIVCLPAIGISQEESFKFLALGDSYTVGTGETLQNSWPVQFVRSLEKKGIVVTTSKTIAKAGWTTTDLLREIANEKETDYDLVSLLIGVNNQYQGIDPTLFENEFRLLLEKSISFTNDDPSKVFVLSIPDWSVTPFAKYKAKDKIVEELDAYNTFIETEAKKQKVTFIDITKMSRNAEVNKALIASDSLHPSKRMYKLWVKKIQKKVLK